MPSVERTGAAGDEVVTAVTCGTDEVKTGAASRSVALTTPLPTSTYGSGADLSGSTVPRSLVTVPAVAEHAKDELSGRSLTSQDACFASVPRRPVARV